MKKIIVWLMMLAVSVAAHAQTITVTGQVLDATDGEPLIGATVTAMHKAGVGAATDIDGNFTLTVPEGTTLKFSYIGYQTAELKAEPEMTVKLMSDSQVLDDVVVIGYQTVRKADLTGAVAVMNMKEPLSENSGNIMSSMAGKMPGVNVVPSSEPGGTGSIRVRGMSTANSSNDPLYIIDGVPTDNINCINPSDIETMQILKDAASASIYGSRAANGVVIITTKHGKGDRLSVNVNYALSASHTGKRLKMLDANEYGQVLWAANRNAGIANPSSPLYGNGAVPVLQPYVAGDINFPTTNLDWQDEIYRTAWTNNLTVSIANNTDKGSVLFSANYINQEGVVKETFYERFSARLNSRFDINKYVSVGENLVVARWTDHGMGGIGEGGIAGSAARMLSAFPVKGTNGQYFVPILTGLTTLSNPVQVLDFGSDDSSASWRILGNAFIEVKPIEGLTLKSNIGIEHSQYFNKGLKRSFYYADPEAGIEEDDESSVTRAFSNGDTWTWTNTANYNKTFNDAHHLTALAGCEAIQYTVSGMDATRYDYMFQDKDFMQLGSSSNMTRFLAGGGKDQYAVFSLFGKVDYNFDDRYLASFTIRNDANSRFAKGHRNGTFPAFSLAWRPTAEPWFPHNDILTDFKVRYSWGQNGNANIGLFYPTYSDYIINTNKGAYPLGGTNAATPGITLGKTGNPDLTWETTTQNNIGVDLQFFNGSLNLTGDFYIKKTTDMLTNPPALDVAGENATKWLNTGTMRNVGWEVSLGYLSPRYGDFSWNGTLTISQYKNKLKELNSRQEFVGSDVRLMKNEPMGVYYGYVCDGIFNNTMEVANHAYQPGAAPGRLKYRDLNGDGQITDLDRCIIGDPNPDLNMGINLGVKYKRVSLDLFFSGEFGFDIINDNKVQMVLMSSGLPYTNRGKDILNAWTPTNTNTDIPAVTTQNLNQEDRFSTFMTSDGSYMKLKYIKVSYDFPEKLLKSWGCQGASLYGQVENVFTMTKYKGLDPEIVPGAWGDRRDNGIYPRSRTFSVGVNLQF